MNSRENKAKDQLKKAQEMLGISDERADEIFTDKPNRIDQKKDEIEKKAKELEDRE
jgi:hypothetical protein